MKKFYLILCTLFVLCHLQTQAQQTIQKIPKDVSMLTEISFNKLTRLMSVKEWDKTEAGKAILKYTYESTGKKLKSIGDMGIDLTGSLYFYLSENDSMQFYNILMPLADAGMTKKLYSEKRIQPVGNASWLVIDEDSSAIQMWDNKHLIYVRASAKDSYFENADVARNHGITIYNPFDYSQYNLDTLEVTLDSSQIIFDEEVILDTTTIPEQHEEEIEEEEWVIEAPEVETPGEYDYDNTEDVAVDHVYFKNKEIKKRLAAICAENYVKDFFNTPTRTSILNNPHYVKSRNDAAVASFFLDNPMKLYKSILPFTKSFAGIHPADSIVSEPMYECFSAYLLMDEKQINISTNTIMSSEIGKLQTEILDRKINPKFLDYVQMDKMLGYMSYAVNTENYLKNYPSILEKTWADLAGIQKDEMMLALEFVSFLLDEEAISNMLPGDALFLLNGLYQHETTYTDYTYDEEYNATPVTKTKNETLPKFLFMMSSEQNKLTDRLIKYGTDKKMITRVDDYYKFTTDFPMQTYFMFKDDIWFFSNQEQDIISIANGSFKPNITEAEKKVLQEPNFSAYFNPMQMHKEISATKFEPTEIMTDVLNSLKKMNTIRIKSLPPTNNSFTTEMLMEVPKGNKNGLVYFMDLMNDIMKK